MHYGLRQVVAPAIEPVSLTAMKDHLVVAQEFLLDDDLITGYMYAAREYA
jgi:hypothetical protein